MYKYTLEQMQRIQKDQLNKLVEVAGNKTHLAAMLGVPLATVNSWLNRGRISKEGARKIEQHKELGKHFKASDLRPELDIYESSSSN